MRYRRFRICCLFAENKLSKPPIFIKHIIYIFSYKFDTVLYQFLDILNLDYLIQQNLNFEKSTIFGCKDIWIRKSDCVANLIFFSSRFWLIKLKVIRLTQHTIYNKKHSHIKRVTVKLKVTAKENEGGI